MLVFPFIVLMRQYVWHLTYADAVLHGLQIAQICLTLLTTHGFSSSAQMTAGPLRQTELSAKQQSQ